MVSIDVANDKGIQGFLAYTPETQKETDLDLEFWKRQSVEKDKHIIILENVMQQMDDILVRLKQISDELKGDYSQCPELKEILCRANAQFQLRKLDGSEWSEITLYDILDDYNELLRENAFLSNCKKLEDFKKQKQHVRLLSRCAFQRAQHLQL